MVSHTTKGLKQEMAKQTIGSRIKYNFTCVVVFLPEFEDLVYLNTLILIYFSFFFSKNNKNKKCSKKISRYRLGCVQQTNLNYILPP